VVERKGGQWVRGAKAGWKAGRKLESLPHIGHDTEGTEKTNHREHGGHGEGKRRDGHAGPPLQGMALV